MPHPIPTQSTIAELAALVAAAVEQAPELKSRPEQAACILLRGKVSPVAENVYEVVNAAGDGTYRVDHAAGTCTCLDFEHRAPTVNGAKLCKHRLAVLFMRKLSQRPSARLARLAALRRPVARRSLREVA